ncbi:hypothetical protein LTR85_000791 [Meristemomyces frigidus]|nr:hypothetical protein LTR85_000791 [Meristemomyces frigidus]
MGHLSTPTADRSQHKMPQENKKKRNQRTKRKHADDDDPAVQESSKRRKSTEGGEEADRVPLPAQDELFDNAYPQADKPFFGMLDEDEQEYFKRADDMLETNAFGDAEERTLFLSNVYREAEGKELKIAQSQSCSRLMERLIQLSNSSQLKQLFQAFSGNFVHLFSHRFASHCCQALFLRAASLVTYEVLAPAAKSADGTKEALSPDEVYVSMENLFLHTLAEIEGSVGYLMTGQYASHVLRVLLLVLAGEPLDQDSTKHLLQSKRKETVTVPGTEPSSGQAAEKSRSVPKSFTEALEKLIAESVVGLDTEQLRALATHPNANPTLQLLLKLELSHFGKQRAKDETSIVRKLLPDDPIKADNGSGAFISGLIYDSVGSHLVEQIVRYAPGKMFKSLNKEFFKEKLALFARNDIAGYVICRVLERMSKDDLFAAHETLIPALPDLLQRNRTLVIRTLIERCAIRDIDTQTIAVQIESAFRGADGLDVKKFLKLEQTPEIDGESRETPHDSVQSSSEETGGPTSSSRPAESSKVHLNLLAQAMLLVPGSLSGLLLDGLIGLEPSALLQMAKDFVATRTLQAALKTRNASIIERRKLVQRFYGNFGEMAVDKGASHVVDCIWEGTHGLAFIRERIAEELAENEAQLRDSQYGRAVWKNWKMDIYKRKRAEWIRQSKVKASNDGFQSFSELDLNKKEGGVKTPLQLARERHAAKRAAKEKNDWRGPSTASNAIVPLANGEATPAATASA